MDLTLESLKQDEKNFLVQLGQIQGALEYNKQLQIFLSKEPEPEQQTTNQNNATL